MIWYLFQRVEFNFLFWEVIYDSYCLVLFYLGFKNFYKRKFMGNLCVLYYVRVLKRVSLDLVISRVFFLFKEEQFWLLFKLYEK